MAKNNKTKKNKLDQTFKPNSNLKIYPITPLTENQQKTFDGWHSGKELFLFGTAGTGKSYIALGLGLNELQNTSDYEKLVIIRSSVSSRQMGFLPGSAKEKMSEYETPYIAMVNQLFDRGDAYSVLKTKGIIEFKSTSFLRGCTFDNAIIFVDEIQNMTPVEIHTVATRIGKNCRVMMAGDLNQNDLANDRVGSGLRDFMMVAKNMDCFEFVEFGIQDIVRSGFVKSYMIARDELEKEKKIRTL